MKLIFFIAFRYFYAKKNIQLTSIILLIALILFSVIGAAMFIIMSIFSGFRQLYFNQLIEMNADLEIEYKKKILRILKRYIIHCTLILM